MVSEQHKRNTITDKFSQKLYNVDTYNNDEEEKQSDSSIITPNNSKNTS